MARGKHRILVVEDNPDQRYLVSTVLQLQGHDVVSAEDGYLGLQYFAAETPDLILLDLLLPGLEGWDVLADVREQSVETPVMIMTGVPGAAQRAGAMGACAVLRKPFDIADLLEAVEKVLEPETDGVDGGNG